VVIPQKRYLKKRRKNIVVVKEKITYLYTVEEMTGTRCSDFSALKYIDTNIM
jgi:hypothetical protein